MKIVLLFVVFTLNVQSQNVIISDTLKRKADVNKPDTALYDMYGLEYGFSQPLKYIIQHSSIGAATAFSLYSISVLSGNTQDEMGIGFMAMPIIGGSIGLISGTVYGIYKWNDDKKIKKENASFYHKSGKYGYNFGISSIKTGKKYSFSNAISVKTDSDVKEYPEVLSLSFEYARWDGTEHRANEIKLGIDGKYYFINKSFYNLFYGLGLGLTYGQYWDDGIKQWRLKEQDKHNFFFFYSNIYLGCGINIFDLLNLNSSVIFEPINSGGVINPGGFGSKDLFIFKATIGTTIF